MCNYQKNMHLHLKFSHTNIIFTYFVDINMKFKTLSLLEDNIREYHCGFEMQIFLKIGKPRASIIKEKMEVKLYQNKKICSSKISLIE